MPTATSFDGNSVNGATDYVMRIGTRDATAPHSAAVSLRQRAGQAPVAESVTYNARVIPFLVALKQGAATTPAAFRENVGKWFAHAKSSGRTLLSTHDDGSTALSMSVYVQKLEQVEYNLFRGEMLAADGIWRSTSTSTDSSSPLTVSGDFDAYPSIAITGSTTTLKRRRVTITDNSTRGLVAYLIQATFDATGVSASASSNYIVFYQNQQIPHYVNTPNDASTKVYFRVDVPRGGSVTVDIYYGSSVSNSITADTLDDAGMDLTSGSFSNTNWIWNDWLCSSHPPVAGAWRYGRIGGAYDQMVGLISESTPQCKFTAGVGTGSVYAGDVAPAIDAIILTLGGVQAGTTNALSGFTANLDKPNSDAFVSGAVALWKRTAGALTWTSVTSRSTVGNLTAPQDVDDATELAFVTNPTATAGTAVSAAATISGSAVALILNSSYTPTVSVAAAVTARYINSTLTSSTTGDVITFSGVYMDDITLTIDCLGKTITTSDSSDWYGKITTNNPAEWYRLAVGANSWTNPTNGSAAMTWYDRYVI